MARTYLVTEDELKSMRVDETGDLILTRDNGEVINAGSVGGDRASGLARSVAGTVALPVTPNSVYELNATSTASVSLTGRVGTQVAIRWSGVAGSVEGTSVSSGQTWVAVRWPSGWVLYEVGGSGVTPLVPGVLSASAVTRDGFTLTVTGVPGDRQFRFSTDAGGTWSSWQFGASWVVTGLAEGVVYECVHQVRDTAGIVATGDMVQVTTSSVLPEYTTVVLHDDFERADTAGSVGWGSPTVGAAWGSGSGDIVTGRGWKATGASSQIQSGVLGTDMDVSFTLAGVGGAGAQAFLIRGVEIVIWDDGRMSLGAGGGKVAVPGWVDNVTPNLYRCITQGGALSIIVNDTPVSLPGTVTFTTQTIGFRSYQAGAYVDDVLVKVP